MNKEYFDNVELKLYALIGSNWNIQTNKKMRKLLKQIAHDQREACHEALNKAVNYEYDCPQRYEMTLWQAWEAVRNAEIEGEE